MSNKDEPEFTKGELENYQKSKKKKPLAIVLTDAELKTFLRLIAAERPSSEFMFKLNLSQRDIELCKQQHSITSVDDAKSRLQDYSEDVAKDEVYMAEQRLLAKQAAKEAQERLEAGEAKRAEARNLLKKKLDPIKIQAEDAKRQKSFSEESARKSQQDTAKVKKWLLPEDVTPAQFRHSLLAYGWSFCQDRFAVNREQLEYMINKLGLTIDKELIRR